MHDWFNDFFLLLFNNGIRGAEHLLATSTPQYKEKDEVASILMIYFWFVLIAKYVSRKVYFTISFSSSNNQFYDSKIFCLYSF